MNDVKTLGILQNDTRHNVIQPKISLVAKNKFTAHRMQNDIKTQRILRDVILVDTA